MHDTVYLFRWILFCDPRMQVKWNKFHFLMVFPVLYIQKSHLADVKLRKVDEIEIAEQI